MEYLIAGAVEDYCFEDIVAGNNYIYVTCDNETQLKAEVENYAEQFENWIIKENSSYTIQVFPLDAIMYHVEPVHTIKATRL